MIRNISDRQPRGNHTKPRIESSELAQKRLEGRLTQPSFLWHQADFGAAPGHPEPIRFGDARPASPIFRPSPMPFRSVDRDLQTKLEPRQEIHLRTRCPHWCPVCKKTSQKLARQNDSVRQPSLEANG